MKWTEANPAGSRPVAAGGPAPGWAGVSAESLRWVFGLYCTFLGAFVLVAPHHFTGPSYAALHPYMIWWGAAALGSGVGLLSIAILQPQKVWTLAIHALAGTTLLALAASFLQRGLWSGCLAYSLLGLGLIVAGWLPYGRPAPGRPTADLFALLMAAWAVVNGTVLALVPGSLPSPYFDAIRPYMLNLGLALILSGLLLGWANLRPSPPRELALAAHLSAGATFLLYGGLLSFPQRAWTGIALYWGCGAVLAVLPWLSRRLAGMDPSSLRTRLAFALAAASSVALVSTAAVATYQEERLATEQVLEARRIEAGAIARNIGDYIRLNAARAFALAAASGRASWAPETQGRLLVATHAAYEDVTASFVLDPAGRLRAAAGRTVPLPAGMLRGLAADLRRQDRRDIGIRLIPAGRTTLLTLTSPILGERAELRGVLVMAFDSEALARRIARPGSSVFLNDGHGREIARSEISPQDLAELLGGSELDEDLAPLPRAWDLQVQRRGVLATPRRLAAFAVVDELGWVVAVERPRAAALSGVRRGRDFAFILLLLVVPLAVTVGIIVARRIAHPLHTLAQAAAGLAAGNQRAPLGESDITELALLSASFGEMRDRLAERTRESERLATELRARAEALADSDRRKDEFLAMLAHELRNPLGAIANAAYVLDRMDSADVPTARSVAVIQRQIQHLVRLVDDLLDVSHITRGKVELRRGPVDFGQVVRHAVETTRPVIDARDHELRLDLPATPLPLHADATRLEQVVGNLLRNAAKYTEPGGRIEVEVHQEGDEAVLAVRDNGMGISADLLPRVFDLFTQGEQDLDRSGGGLGIGLTLVRSLVEMHGGRVEAGSEGTGRGSRFVVRLPLSETAAQYLPTTPRENVLPGAREATSSPESR